MAVRFTLRVPLKPKNTPSRIEYSQARMAMKVAAEKWRKIPISSSIFGKWRFLHNGPDTVEELLDRHLVKKQPPNGDDEEDPILARQRLTSTRREALSLYRDILRAARFFAWPDARGVPWRDVLRDNARREFEEARYERDPEIVTRLLIGGRDAVQAALDKLVDQHKRMAAGDGKNDRTSK